MHKLYLGLTGLTIVFSCAMCFGALAVYDDAWWPGAVAGGLFIVFLAASGAIPRILRTFTGGERRTGRAATIMFSSWWGLAFFIMAMVTWTLGKRSVGPNDAYLTLGLLVFLGLLGAGIQGVIAMTGWFVHVRNQAIVVPARKAALDASHH